MLQPSIQFFRLRFDLLPRPDHQFRSRRRSRRPQIGDKIHDGEIRLVPDGRDHGNLRIRDGSRQPLMVETGEVFGRASATRNDDDLNRAAATQVLMKASKSGHHFPRRRIPLHLRRIDQHIRRMMPSCQNVQDVAQRRALW